MPRRYSKREMRSILARKNANSYPVMTNTTVTSVRRRAKYSRNKNSLTIRSIGAPSSIFVKLPYVETVSNTDSAALFTYLFQSSCFDPNNTGTGHQPRYFDQWATLYNRYQVLAMLAEVEFFQIDSSAIPTVAAIAWSENTGAFSTVDNCAESKYSKRGIIQGTGSRPYLKLKSFMKSSTIHGTKGSLQQEDEQALINASPSDMFYLNVMWQAADGVTTTQNYFRVKLIYYVRFFDQKDPAAS